MRILIELNYMFIGRLLQIFVKYSEEYAWVTTRDIPFQPGWTKITQNTLSSNTDCETCRRDMKVKPGSFESPVSPPSNAQPCCPRCPLTTWTHRLQRSVFRVFGFDTKPLEFAMTNTPSWRSQTQQSLLVSPDSQTQQTLLS